MSQKSETITGVVPKPVQSPLELEKGSASFWGFLLSSWPRLLSGSGCGLIFLAVFGLIVYKISFTEDLGHFFGLAANLLLWPAFYLIWYRKALSTWDGDRSPSPKWGNAPPKCELAGVSRPGTGFDSRPPSENLTIDFRAYIDSIVLWLIVESFQIFLVLWMLVVAAPGIALGYMLKAGAAFLGPLIGLSVTVLMFRYLWLPFIWPLARVLYTFWGAVAYFELIQGRRGDWWHRFSVIYEDLDRPRFHIILRQAFLTRLLLIAGLSLLPKSWPEINAGLAASLIAYLAGGLFISWYTIAAAGFYRLHFQKKVIIS